MNMKLLLWCSLVAAVMLMNSNNMVKAENLCNKHCTNKTPDGVQCARDPYYAICNAADNCKWNSGKAKCSDGCSYVSKWAICSPTSGCGDSHASSCAASASYNECKGENCPTYLSKWTSWLKDSTQLSQIAIPGTHDTGTFGAAASDVAYKCQSWTFGKQLLSGVRFFDVRLAWEIERTKKGRIHKQWMGISHGSGIKSKVFTTWGELLSAFKSFFDNNPQETVIMSIKDEKGGMPQAGKDFLNEELKKGRFVTSFSASDPISKHRGKVLVFNREIDSVVGQAWPTKVYDNWSVAPSNLDDKMREVRNFVVTRGTEWNICFTSSSVKVVPRDSARALNRFVHHSVQNWNGVNIILFDFPGYDLLERIAFGRNNAAGLFDANKFPKSKIFQWILKTLKGSVKGSGSLSRSALRGSSKSKLSITAKLQPAAEDVNSEEEVDEDEESVASESMQEDVDAEESSEMENGEEEEESGEEAANAEESSDDDDDDEF